MTEKETVTNHANNLHQQAEEKVSCRYVCLCLAIFLILLYPLSAAAADKVRLQLKWRHQFQFAGYYAAQARGYYQAAGLDVEIISGQPGEDTVQNVLQGKAEFGVSATDLLLLREQGAPVVALAVIFQHSPLALMTLRRSGLQSIHDLAGRKVMIEPDSSELYAYLRKEGISSCKFTLLPHGFQTKDLLAGNVDAMSTYVTDEPFELSKAGQEYLLYSPRAVGIDFYGDNLFTTESQLKLNPEMVNAFREASLKGWEYAMQNPEELIQLIYSRYSQRHSIEHLRFEASQMAPLLQTALVQIGHMNPGRWRHIAETYAELGMMKPDFNLKGFLYDPNPPPLDLRWLYVFMGVATMTIAIVSTLAVYIYRINVRLRQGVAERKQAEEEKAELEAQNRQLQKAESLGRMAGAIAHHFNNQLQAVMGNLEMAMDMYLPQGLNPIDSLASAMQAACKAAEISGLLLTYLGQMLGKHAPLDLSEVCRQSLSMLQASAPKSLSLKAEFLSSGPVICANADQIKQVLINLVTNACEAAGENQGAIGLTVNTVSLADIPTLKRFPINWQPKENVYACLKVADEGQGIPDGDIDNIFDPFFTTNFTGRGLGLSVVLGIVGAYGGGVTVESEQGRGSIFRVFLPVSTEEIPCLCDLPAKLGALQTGKTKKLQD